MTRIEDEDAVLRELGLGQPAAVVLAANEPRQQIFLGISRIAAALVDQTLQIIRERAHRAIAQCELLIGQHRLESLP